jgi:hypothetical protein
MLSLLVAGLLTALLYQCFISLYHLHIRALMYLFEKFTSINVIISMTAVVAYSEGVTPHWNVSVFFNYRLFSTLSFLTLQ